MTDRARARGSIPVGAILEPFSVLVASATRQVTGPRHVGLTCLYGRARNHVARFLSARLQNLRFATQKRGSRAWNRP